jgi:acyl-CoA hydrolase
MEWQKRYRSKLAGAAAAVRCIERGDRVFIGSGAAEPQTLVQALVERSGELEHTEILHILTLGPACNTFHRGDAEKSRRQGSRWAAGV